ASADRNLLYGFLATQMDFITRDQLVAAMQAWVADKAKPLGAILVTQGALANDTHTLLEALVQKHLTQHDDDPYKSLAAVPAPASLKEELKRVADPDVQASLIHAAPTKPDADLDIYATRAPSMGEIGELTTATG